jgi:hypothetical protein
LAHHWHVPVAKVETVENSRSSSQWGSVESYQVWCHSRVCWSRRAKFAATYSATDRASENRVA